jgi:hypothetical protein
MLIDVKNDLTQRKLSHNLQCITLLETCLYYVLHKHFLLQTNFFFFQLPAKGKLYYTVEARCIYIESDFQLKYFSFHCNFITHI